MTIATKIVPIRRGYERKCLSGYEGIARAAKGVPEKERAGYLLDYLKEVMLDADASVGVWPDRKPLTEQQRVIFCHLYRNEGRTVRNKQMEAAMYPDADSMPEDPRNVLKVRICQIRSKIKDTGLFIDTVWGEGYRLERAPGLVLPWEASQ